MRFSDRLPAACRPAPPGASGPPRSRSGARGSQDRRLALAQAQACARELRTEPFDSVPQPSGLGRGYGKTWAERSGAAPTMKALQSHADLRHRLCPE